MAAPRADVLPWRPKAGEIPAAPGVYRFSDATGRILWDELVHRYTEGVDEVKQMRRDWNSLRGLVDAERFNLTAQYLAIQEAEAKWWRDACLAYFQSFSRMPYPKGYAPPAHDLAYYKSLDARKNLDTRLAVGLSN